MITIDINPVLFGFGHFAMRWYGVIVAASIGLGAWVASREARRKGVSSEVFQDVLLWVILGAGPGIRLSTWIPTPASRSSPPTPAP